MELGIIAYMCLAVLYIVCSFIILNDEPTLGIGNCFDYFLVMIHTLLEICAIFSTYGAAGGVVSFTLSFWLMLLLVLLLFCKDFTFEAMD
jgi:hypothetical protein